MKQVLLDILRGLRAAMFYIGVICILGMGVWLICTIHTVPNPWIAVVRFILALVFIAGGFLSLWALGLCEREQEEDDR